MARRHYQRRDSEPTYWAFEAGNKRAREEGLTNCKFQEGDASDLHEIKNHSFDLLVSIFGAMFAPKPFDAAKEMVCVTRPGGRIVMGNWIPNDPTLVAQILKISAAYSPPLPQGFFSPMTWGIEGNVIERFAAAGVPKESISFVRDTYSFNFPGPPSEFVEAFRKYYGPTMNAFDAAEKNVATVNCKRSWKPCSTAKQEPKQGCHLHSCDLPPRGSCAHLTGDVFGLLADMSLGIVEVRFRGVTGHGPMKKVCKRICKRTTRHSMARSG